ncbi:MAG TPA: TIGR00303 family protein [Methanoregulaceae archaeon]|nr:TIGR00303 family protein [Methanoregulaceae archaeon]
MPFISRDPGISGKNPLFCSILGNTALSTVPGVSGAGPTPQKTLYTPILDAELIEKGKITSMPAKPDTPTGCPTPASITRAVLDLMGLSPLFINAGLVHRPTVPCLDVYGEPGKDPRFGEAVPQARTLFEKGALLGKLLCQLSDLAVVGECVPGGTTTALCSLRALGYDARVSSSYVNNPVMIKEEIWLAVKERLEGADISDPLDIIRYTGDPMIPVCAGMATTCRGKMVLAGGTQMLAVAAVLKALGHPIPPITTTCYVRDDPSANFGEIAKEIGVEVFFIDPDFGRLGHSGLARYCIGEVKEGMGAGGAMFLAYVMGYGPEEIRGRIFETVNAYS